MATVTTTKTWASGDVLTAADLNAEFSNLLNALAIVNADISASAAIAYSKLNLTGNIVNADVSSSAAIAASKISGTAMTLSSTDTITGVKTFSAEPVFNAGVQVADAQDIYFTSGAKIERVDGNIVLTPESSKLVKLAVYDGAYQNNTVIACGSSTWTGAANDVGNKAVTYGITFTSAPKLIIGIISSSAGAGYTYPPELTSGPTTTGFTWAWRVASGTLTSVVINWIAIGPA